MSKTSMIASFQTPTIIHHDEHEFIFEGFSLFTTEPLKEMPVCNVLRSVGHVFVDLVLICLSGDAGATRKVLTRKVLLSESPKSPRNFRPILT